MALFDAPTVKLATRVLITLNHRLRGKMLGLLHQHGELQVNELVKKLRLEQSVASYHLARLREARLVTVERRGKLRVYKPVAGRISELEALAYSIVKKAK